MRVIKNFKNFLYKADFFYTTQLLRYKDQPQYRTLFGGILSLIIIIILIATFYNKFLDTLNKVVITSVSSNLNAADPTPYTISTSLQDQFMFGVQVWHHDLNTGLRFFDVVLTIAQFQTGQRKSSSVQYPLQPCQLSHWQGFPQVQSQYKRLNMNQWLCIQKNMSYSIHGKYASKNSQTLQAAVKPCTNNSKQARQCASQQQIDKYFQDNGPFYFTIYFINPLINPTSEKYLTYYLQDNNYIIFSKKLGAQGILFMQEYSINTDQSILPFTQIRKDAGGIVSELAVKNPYQVTDNLKVYCSFSFFKSGISRSYQRNFQKIDQILSYIGGLFGTIAFSLVIINAYNSNSFEITLGAYLFQNKDQIQGNILKKYNFLSYIAHLMYMFLQTIGCTPNWQTIQKYYDCRQQMRKQLDILYLLQRVFFLQKIVSNLVDGHQLKGLHLQQKMTLQEAKKNRKDFKIKRRIFKMSKKLQRKRQKNGNNNCVINITEQSFQGMKPVIYNNYQNEGILDIKSNSNERQMNQIDQIKRMNILQSNIDRKNIINKQMNSDSGSSQQDENEDDKNLIDIDRLRQQSQGGNILSSKIWCNINMDIKRNINIIDANRRFRNGINEYVDENKRYINEIKRQISDDKRQISDYKKYKSDDKKYKSDDKKYASDNKNQISDNKYTGKNGEQQQNLSFQLIQSVYNFILILLSLSKNFHSVLGWIQIKYFSFWIIKLILSFTCQDRTQYFRI